jgi:hypothetical protein
MRTRTLLAISLDIALAAVAVFYLLAPTVYTFFSEAQLSYSKSPRWFASTAPARLTAQFFDRYNASAPRAARFQRQLSCFLADEGASRRAGCLHEIRARDAVYGPPLLKIASGHYVASFAFSETAACSGGSAHLQVLTPGRYGRVLAEYSGSFASGQTIELPFQLKLMDAALSPLEFRVSGLDGCLVLQRAGWTDAATGR